MGKHLRETLVHILSGPIQIWGRSNNSKLIKCHGNLNSCLISPNTAAWPWLIPVASLNLSLICKILVSNSVIFKVLSTLIFGVCPWQTTWGKGLPNGEIQSTAKGSHGAKEYLSLIL